MQFPVGNVFYDFLQVEFQSVKQENTGNTPVDKFIQIENLVIGRLVGNKFSRNDHQNQQDEEKILPVEKCFHKK